MFQCRNKTSDYFFVLAFPVLRLIVVKHNYGKVERPEDLKSVQLDGLVVPANTLFLPADPLVSDAETAPVAVLVPGNPGVAEYYIETMREMHRVAKGAMHIYCIGHVGQGFIVDNTKLQLKPMGSDVLSNFDLDDPVGTQVPEWLTYPYGEGALYGLREQVSHKMSVLSILRRKHPHSRFVLAGHSVGAFICLEMMRTIDRVEQIVRGEYRRRVERSEYKHSDSGSIVDPDRDIRAMLDEHDAIIDDVIDEDELKRVDAEDYVAARLERGLPPRAESHHVSHTSSSSSSSSPSSSLGLALSQLADAHTDNSLNPLGLSSQVVGGSMGGGKYGGMGGYQRGPDAREERLSGTDDYGVAYGVTRFMYKTRHLKQWIHTAYPVIPTASELKALGCAGCGSPECERGKEMNQLKLKKGSIEETKGNELSEVKEVQGLRRKGIEDKVLSRRGLVWPQLNEASLHAQVSVTDNDPCVTRVIPHDTSNPLNINNSYIHNRPPSDETISPRAQLLCSLRRTRTIMKIRGGISSNTQSSLPSSPISSTNSSSSSSSTSPHSCAAPAYAAAHLLCPTVHCIAKTPNGYFFTPILRNRILVTFILALIASLPGYIKRFFLLFSVNPWTKSDAYSAARLVGLHLSCIPLLLHVKPFYCLGYFPYHILSTTVFI